MFTAQQEGGWDCILVWPRTPHLVIWFLVQVYSFWLTMLAFLVQASLPVRHFWPGKPGKPARSGVLMPPFWYPLCICPLKIWAWKLVSVGNLSTHAYCHEVLIILLKRQETWWMIWCPVVVRYSSVGRQDNDGSVVGDPHSVGRVLNVAFHCQKVCWGGGQPRVLDVKASFLCGHCR